MAAVDEVELPMVCTCKEEGRQHAANVMGEVLARLSEGSRELSARPVTMDNFVTAVVHSLNWDHNAHIARIDNDQWSAVTVDKDDHSLRLRVECDRVEDGIAAAWKALADGPPYEATSPVNPVVGE